LRCNSRSGIKLCRTHIFDQGAGLRACNPFFQDLAVARERGLNSHRPGVSARVASLLGITVVFVGGAANKL
jgi:hypothetical protein